MRRSKRDAFKTRVADWASRLELTVSGVTVRKMQKKWASCSRAGRLTFDQSLLLKPNDLQDYVIVHELLHLAVPNHGKLWKSLMRAHLGEYEALERRLQRLSEQTSAEPFRTTGSFHRGPVRQISRS
jgi:predicted metal-dependent hydrolase